MKLDKGPDAQKIIELEGKVAKIFNRRSILQIWPRPGYNAKLCS
jgi:hypothetical protein